MLSLGRSSFPYLRASLWDRWVLPQPLMAMQWRSFSCKDYGGSNVYLDSMFLEVFRSAPTGAIRPGIRGNQDAQNGCPGNLHRDIYSSSP